MILLCHRFSYNLCGPTPESEVLFRTIVVSPGQIGFQDGLTDTFWVLTRLCVFVFTVPNTCTVDGCGREEENVFSFPKEKEYSDSWMRVCCLDGATNPNNAFICSFHFHLEGFIDDMNTALFVLQLWPLILSMIKKTWNTYARWGAANEDPEEWAQASLAEAISQPVSEWGCGSVMGNTYVTIMGFPAVAEITDVCMNHVCSIL